MSFLNFIAKQSPWIFNLGDLHKDVHITRLNTFPLIYKHKKFLSYKFQDGVYILTGPRQIGKSTLLKTFIQNKIEAATKENFLYFNCDILDKKQDIVELIEEYLTKFPSKHRRYILLDEITSIKDSFLAIKYLIDSGACKKITYILTGSNTINIKQTGEYLPGRRGKGIDFVFNPLSFKEVVQLIKSDWNLERNFNTSELELLKLKQLNLKPLLNTYLITGGFPRVINEYYQNKTINEDVFTIYRSWITSEIAKADKKEFIAKAILNRALISLGSDISYNSFAQDTGIGSHNTIYDYLDFFSNAYILSTIFNYEIYQKKVNYKKNKKIYFNDPFIFSILEAWLSGKTTQDYDYLNNPIIKSQLIENLVFLHLKRKFTGVYFYKDKSEIDFIINNNLFEVKYQNNIIPDDYKFLLKQDGNKILITKNKLKKEQDVLFMPIEYFLAFY